MSQEEIIRLLAEAGSQLTRERFHIIDGCHECKDEQPCPVHARTLAVLKQSTANLGRVLFAIRGN